MADWKDFGQGKTRNELSHGGRIYKMLTSKRIKALKTVIVQKIKAKQSEIVLENKSYSQRFIFTNSSVKSKYHSKCRKNHKICVPQKSVSKKPPPEGQGVT